MTRRVAFAAILVLGVSQLAWAQQPGAPVQKPAGGTAAPEPWYSATRVAEKVWRIDDHGSDNMYLVEGAKQALLIDTGLGVARLGDFVTTLTRLPIVVVNTHGHVDHAGGNGFFPVAYVHPADSDAVRAVNTPESRRNAAGRMAKNTAASGLLSPDEAAQLGSAELLPLREGQGFDLGGRRLEVVEQPGHTPGEVVLIDKANRLAFTGDNDNTLVWLFLPTSRPLEVYLASLEKLRQRAGEFDTILPGHGGPLPAPFLDDQIACVKDILGGACSGEPYQSFAGSARVCKHGAASVAFDPRNLRLPK